MKPPVVAVFVVILLMFYFSDTDRDEGVKGL
jgi:hypothetical protein